MEIWKLNGYIVLPIKDAILYDGCLQLQMYYINCSLVCKIYKNGHWIAPVIPWGASLNPDWSFLLGRGRKRSCGRTQITSAKPKSLNMAVSPRVLKALSGVLMLFHAIWAFVFSILIQNGKKTPVWHYGCKRLLFSTGGKISNFEGNYTLWEAAS